MQIDTNEFKKKGLIDELGGTAAGAPLGGAAPPIAPSDPLTAAPPIQADGPAAAPKFNTRLMEGDAGKLADPTHAAKSPKYDFLQLAQKGTHDYKDLGGMLSELQGGANQRLWQGWTANGDKLKFSGDPSQLASEWNGVREVDAIGGFHDPKGPQGFRWGAEDPNAAPSGAPSPGRPSFGGSTIAPMLQGDAQGGIQQALGNIGGLANNDRIQQLIAALAGGQQ